MRLTSGPTWLLLLLSGCAATPLQQPLLSLARTDCDTRPAFEAAVPVRTEDRRATSVVLESGGRCMLVPGGAPTTYAVFELPRGPEPYSLDVLSSVVPPVIVRPVATLYDAAGQPVRTVPPEEFEVNIAGLRAGVRPNGTERWLVVAADQARLGQSLHMQLGRSDGGVQVAAAVFIPIIIVPPRIPDLVRQRDAIYALNGQITVAAVSARVAR